MFYNVEGTPESKFDLYKTTCEEIKDKVLHNIKSLDILQCKTENVDISGYDRKWFAKRYFELMCNLKVNEYLGYVQVVLGKTLEEGIDCVKLIEQPSAKVDEDSFNNFCR